MQTRFMSLMMALALVSGCGGGSTEPTTTEHTETAEATEPEVDSADDVPAESARAVPGGWGEGDVNADGPRAAAAFAVQEQSRVSGDTIELVSIAWVSQQVVSGMNYRLGLNVTRNGTAAQATAEVYSQPWTSTTQLTGWTYGATR
ncbi:MAG: hypothetical protein H6725_07405 [Sandaracinaceae bacterium]|nr:hypothetical protein [Sandaracinaceae bacterium]